MNPRFIRKKAELSDDIAIVREELRKLGADDSEFTDEEISTLITEAESTTMYDYSASGPYVFEPVMGEPAPEIGEPVKGDRHTGGNDDDEKHKMRVTKIRVTKFQKHLEQGVKAFAVGFASVVAAVLIMKLFKKV